MFWVTFKLPIQFLLFLASHHVSTLPSATRGGDAHTQYRHQLLKNLQRFFSRCFKNFFPLETYLVDNVYLPNITVGQGDNTASDMVPSLHSLSEEDFRVPCE